MTQKYIRENANLRWWQRWYLSVSDSARRFYNTLLEPRVVTSIYGGVYSIILAAGIYSVIFVPVQLEHIEGGRLLMSLIGSFLIVGGAGGIHTIMRGDQWAERYTLWTILVGVAFYWWTITWAAATMPGPRAMGVIGWLLAGVLLVLRFHWILDRPNRPGSRADKQRKKRERRGRERRK